MFTLVEFGIEIEIALYSDQSDYISLRGCKGCRDFEVHLAEILKEFFSTENFGNLTELIIVLLGRPIHIS